MQNLIKLLMQARTLFHIIHLKSSTYEEHIAIGELYNGLNDLIDILVEQYQGMTGAIIDLSSMPGFTTNGSTIEHVKDISNDIRSIYQSYDNKNTTTDSILDDILQLFDTTCYKLRFLK
jgi:hypothetical protein